MSEKAFLTDDIPQIVSPINLDRAIQELQNALKSKLSWLKQVYGRARVMPERVGEKVYNLPKVYKSEKEYLNVLLNDNVDASCWFQVIGAEMPLDYAPLNVIQKYQVPIALILWFNLEKVRLDLTNEDYVHTELLKRQVHNVIGRYPNVTISRVFDEHARDIFREYTTEVEKEQFLAYPKGGLRFEFLLTYDYDCSII
jgi:hypothetical protein